MNLQELGYAIYHIANHRGSSSVRSFLEEESGNKVNKKNKEDEPVEETPKVVEPAVVEVPQDIELLTEIRDLLKEHKEKNE